MQKNASLLAIVAVDTAENEPSEVGDAMMEAGVRYARSAAPSAVQEAARSHASVSGNFQRWARHISCSIDFSI